MHILKNDFLEVTLNPKGAEIISIIGQSDKINYMWKRDPIQWANSAPILFPIVGKVRNDEYRIAGNTYNLTSHGFARHSIFEVVDKTDIQLTYKLVSNDEIIKQYPFIFELFVTYTLSKDTLECHCKVVNKDSKEMYFQIGGHPAFSCPFMDNESSNDYYLEFSDNETLMEKILDPKLGGMSNETRPFLENEKRFFIRQEAFNRDAIVLENFKSKTLTLKSLNHSKTLTVTMDGFTHLGIWAAKHVGGLVAIEPWVGHTDYIDFEGEFKDKTGAKTLLSNEEFECCFKITINQ